MSISSHTDAVENHRLTPYAKPSKLTEPNVSQRAAVLTPDSTPEYIYYHATLENDLAL